MTYDSCQQLRRFKVTYGSLNMATGEIAAHGDEWKTDKCGVPLFGDDARKRGTCKSCHSGWTHPDNYPVKEGATQ